MSETFGNGFGFGSYADEESKEVPQTQEMKEAPSDKNTQEFTSEIQAPELKKKTPRHLLLDTRSLNALCVLRSAADFVSHKVTCQQITT